MIFRLGLSALFFCGSAAAGKTVLDREALYRLLDQNNPYTATAIANQTIQESKLLYTKGEFDTKLGAKHDEKQYPLGDARLSDIYLEKPMENGLEMLVGYRKADGIQEYSNIKTGDEGEFRVGVKIPLVEIASGINQRQLLLKSAQIDTKSSYSQSQKQLRELYFNSLKTYYQLVYQQELLQLEEELLEKAHHQYGLIEKRVRTGDEAPIVLVEARQLVNERKQRRIESANTLSALTEHLISYLNISRGEFEAAYEIPSLPSLKDEVIDGEGAFQKALENRPELKMLKLEKERLLQEMKMVQVIKYPKIDASVYGVHDRLYDNGFKVSLEFSFPIEQQKFEGKSAEIRTKQDKNTNEMKKSVLELQRQISVTVDTLHALKENMTVVMDEIALAEELERAELRKFDLGQSGLFLLNQRQMKTLQARQKKAAYHLQSVLGLLELERETGELDGQFLALIGH